MKDSQFMKADVTELAEIFERSRQLEVPFFQRPYVWRMENWEPFYTDVIRTVNEIEAGEKNPHFFGAVILDEESTITLDIDRRQIIDGQQRLITTQLLYIAARDIAKQEEWTEYQEQLDELILNRNRFPDEDRPKVRPIDPDNGDFAKLAFGNSGRATPDTRITACYQYFRDRLTDWIKDADPKVRFRSLLLVLKAYLLVVLIDIENGDDAQAIFETLNNRGLNLAKSDLIWNHLIREARNSNLSQDEIRIDLAEAQFIFQDKYWREEQPVARQDLPRIDIFMMQFLAMKTLKFVTHKNIFKGFKDWYKDCKQELSFHEIIQTIVKYGKISRDWQNASPDNIEGSLVKNLELIGTTSVHPLFLWLFGLDRERISKADLLAIIQIVESYMFRRLIGGFTASGYNRHFLSILSQLRKKENLYQSVLELLLSYDTTTTKWPTDLEIQEALTNYQFGRRMRRDRSRYILSRIDKHLMNQEEDFETHNYDSMTLEHLMPRGWRPELWPLENEDEYSHEIRNNVIELIGNLTLLTGPLNSKISNGSWGAKRETLLRLSALALNRPLPEVWDEDAIHKRTRDFAEIICQIWPRPELGSLPEAAE